MSLTPRYAKIVSVGAYRPARAITNDDLDARLGERFPGLMSKFEARTGIRCRWACPEDWATSDLALPAARQALERAGVPAEDVDLIIVGTDSPDFVTPATSVVLAEKLGATNAGTFDVGCACASFPTAVGTAHGLMATNPSLNNVLVLGVYLMRRLCDPEDPMVFFYGDGAGAVLLQPSTEPGVLGFASQADGSYAKKWGIYAGGTAEPASVAAIEGGRTTVKLLDRYPPAVNEEGWPRLTRRLLKQLGRSLSDIDLIVFTQVRKPTIEAVMETLGLPWERTHTIMEETGYTGSACLPMAYADAVDTGRVSAGDFVVLVGSGVGYNQAATAWLV